MDATVLEMELELASEIAEAIKLQERLIEISNDTIKGVAGHEFPSIRAKAEDSILSAEAKISLKKVQLKAVLERIICKL